MLDYHGDIVADLRVLANVADWRALSGPEFFTLALRLPLYRGALRRTLRAEYEADQAAARSGAGLAELDAMGWLEK